MKALQTGRSETLHYDLNHQAQGGLDSLCGGSSEVFVHVVKRRPHILLAGGGHVAFEVARLCDQLDWLYSVLDDRPDFASRERYPNASNHYLLSPRQLEGRLDPSTFTHVLIAGYDHHKDYQLLSWLLPRFDGHLASIGSARKRKQFDRKLAEEGHAQERIASLECPVGLPIGAETPAEIAVSILASFIQQASGGLAGDG
jgi:xanthine dehydrogenase accessory factor